MSNHSRPQLDNTLAGLRQLSLEEIEHRLSELDAERAALSLLRRSMLARDRARRRAAPAATPTEGRRGA